jgi:hypothetical protein
MFDKLKALWGRLRVRWHVLAVALLAAAPEILNYLGVIDLKPILSQFLPDNWVSLIVGILPFVLVFLKSVISVEPVKDQ